MKMKKITTVIMMEVKEKRPSFSDENDSRKQKQHKYANRETFVKPLKEAIFEGSSYQCKSAVSEAFLFALG